MSKVLVSSSGKVLVNARGELADKDCGCCAGEGCIITAEFTGISINSRCYEEAFWPFGASRKFFDTNFLEMGERQYFHQCICFNPDDPDCTNFGLFYNRKWYTYWGGNTGWAAYGSDPCVDGSIFNSDDYQRVSTVILHFDDMWYGFAEVVGQGGILFHGSSATTTIPNALTYSSALDDMELSGPLMDQWYGDGLCTPGSGTYNLTVIGQGGQLVVTL